MNGLIFTFCHLAIPFSRIFVVVILVSLQEVGCGYVDWIGLAQDRDRWRKLASLVVNLGVS